MSELRAVHSYAAPLDETGNNRIQVRFILSQNETELEAFAVVFLSRTQTRLEEIVRVDGSLSEPVNVHRFYANKKQKQFLNKPLSLLTLQESISDIEKNWQWYLAQYRESKGL